MLRSLRSDVSELDRKVQLTFYEKVKVWDVNGNKQSSERNQSLPNYCFFSKINYLECDEIILLQTFT